MLLDYNAGRRCEVDAINGAIPRLGKPLGVATPVNETVGGIIKARERRRLAIGDATKGRRLKPYLSF
jgi:2-dehydropantoate 2-reductase